MTISLLLALYSVSIIAVALLGATVSGRVQIKHTHMQLVMSLVSGLMLGIAIFHLMPHGLQEVGGMARLDSAMVWLMTGLLAMFLLLRLFHFHQHDITAEDHDHHSEFDSCAHGESHSHQGSFAWLGAFLGLAIHTLIDGVALGAAIMAEAEGHHSLSWAGIGVFIAIMLHKPLDAFTISTLMRRSGKSKLFQLVVVAFFALMIPIGATIFMVSTSAVDHSHLWVGFALMFSAGVFLCISLSDLLPELHFHSHDRLKLTLLLCAGIVTAYLITGIEPYYHGHH